MASQATRMDVLLSLWVHRLSYIYTRSLVDLHVPYTFRLNGGITYDAAVVIQVKNSERPLLERLFDDEQRGVARSRSRLSRPIISQVKPGCHREHATNVPPGRANSPPSSPTLRSGYHPAVAVMIIGLWNHLQPPIPVVSNRAVSFSPGFRPRPIMSVAEINHRTRPLSIMSVISDGAETPSLLGARPRTLSDSGSSSEQRRRENKSLELRVQSFKVQQSDSSRAPGGPSSGRPLRSSTTARRLGSLQGMEARSATCALCALIVRSAREAGTQKPPTDQLPDESAEAQLQRATCFVSWEIDGREAASTGSPGGRSPKNLVRGVTRRMHIRWNHPRLSDAYLVYVAPDTFSRTASDADRVWVKDSLFLGRAITDNIENQALIQSWLDLCRKTHKGPCRRIDDGRAERFIEMISHSYFGVIDVQNMQLTQLPCQSQPSPRGHNRRPPPQHCGEILEQVRPEPYVALSYVWGADPTAYTTRTENVMLHRTHGGLEEVLQKLPTAIRDAVDLTRRLGFRYIWVDRLCIVQNSARSWKLNAYNMDLIYGNAALTICAADGDAARGLCAMRPATRNTRQVRALVAPRLELMATRPPEMYIRASEWNERAWTFQERLLSRRCLIFTNGRVYFQCRSTGMSEDIFGDQRGAGWSLDLVDAPLQMFRQLDNRSIWVYMKCVELYTERKLTQAKDIQAAFSGMANLMEGRMRAPFIHGLPSSHFDLALLWEPTRSSKRRVTGETRENASIPDFPSWSWTGWVGEVQYKEDTVSGILDNVSDWLDTRTWIEWWVRDGNGDLRPLWDPKESREDQSKERKWRGYTQRRASRGEGRGRRRNEHEHGIDAPYVTDYILPFPQRGPPGTYNTSSESAQNIEASENYHSERYDDNSDDEDDGSLSLRQREEMAREQDDFRERQEIRAREHRDHYESRGSEYNPYAPARFQPHSAPAGPPQPRRHLAPQRPAYFASPRDERGHPRPRVVSTYRPRGIYVEPQVSRPRHHRHASAVWHSAPPPPPSAAPPPPMISTDEPRHNADFFDMFFDGRGRGDDEFSITLRDYPYRVVKAPFDARPETAEHPLLPILQFRTWHAWLYIHEARDGGGEDNNNNNNNNRQRTANAGGGGGGGLVRHHIADEGGDWCGSIALDAAWAAGKPARQEFVAVSEAKGFSAAECREWTYYVPKERDQSEWDLFYVLLVERRDERWERVGVGKVFKEAFRGREQKEIMLG
ncbi:HET-domain-containing protein [Colletotrichum zoysiae]|uniref:HET-domain-containing protein n=1 Tax=Colletotrichum zoysiae TaxID=1216348 RepID=A0AAD9H869_9PEZI|nr:HET-domain-containing protein [Colletotrichum zoysiae]